MSALPKFDTLLPDLEQAERFLTLLDEEAEAFTFATFTDGKDKPKRDPLAKIRHGTLDACAGWLTAMNQSGAGVFVTVNETDGHGRKLENITSIRALWQEADRGDEPALPIDPHIAVESSPGKHHRYVLVDGAPLDEFEPVQRRLVDDYGSDPNAKDRSRVLRLPGFFHLKDPARPHRVQLVHESGAQAIPWSEALRHFPPVPDSDRRFTGELPPEGTPLTNAAEIRSALKAIDPDEGFGDWLAVGMALHSTGAGLQAFQLWDDWSAAGALYKEGECAHRWQTFRRDRENLVTIKSLFGQAKAAGWKGRTYGEILADAEAMDADTAPEAIEALIAEAVRLPPVQRQRVATAIKRTTGTPLGVIRQAAAAAFQSADGDEPDHLALARSVINGVGKDNIIGTQSHVWRYQVTGVWRPLEMRGEKHIVQSHLDNAHADQTITKNLVDSVTDTLRNEVYRPAHEWNVGPADAVVVKNGELVLRDGQWHLEPHERAFYRTVLVPVEYDPQARAERFLEFLEDIFQQDADQMDKRLAVVEMIGYTLMSHAALERFALLVGNGANGKSVLLSVIEALCGRENVTGVQPSEFDNKFQRAHLHLKLANIVTEVREGEVIADAALKSIVSGEPTTVEHKFRDPFEFRPYATCWFGTNHLPHTRDFSDALFRRALVVPFNRKFEPGVDADPRLKDRLIEELPGILNLALDAYARVVERGAFTEPESCVQAKLEWRLEADQAAQFVDDCCETGEGEIQSSDLFAVYRTWAQAAGINRTLSQRGFTQRLERMGHQRSRTKSARLIHGLRLNQIGKAYQFENIDFRDLR